MHRSLHLFFAAELEALPNIPRTINKPETNLKQSARFVIVDPFNISALLANRLPIIEGKREEFRRTGVRILLPRGAEQTQMARALRPVNGVI